MTLIGIGAAVDWMILYAGQYLGIALDARLYTAGLTAVWLICNEIVSILENLGDIGVALPPFLRKMVEWVQRKLEQKECCEDQK